MAHSPAAVIAARMNHAPQLAPVMKSPIPLPLPLAPNITLDNCPVYNFWPDGLASSTVASPQHHRNNFSGRNTLPTVSHNLLGNDDPDLVGASWGMGTWSGPGSHGRTGPDFIEAPIFNNLILIKKSLERGSRKHVDGPDCDLRLALVWPAATIGRVGLVRLWSSPGTSLCLCASTRWEI